MSKYPDLFDSIFMKLTHIQRFSDQSLSKNDSDADHTIRLQLMVLEIFRNCPSFNLSVACMKALAHDLEETVICDIPRTIKYHSEEFHKSFEDMTNELIKENDFGPQIEMIMRNAKDESIEGWIIKFVDILDAYSTLNREAWIQHSPMFETEASRSLGWLKQVTEAFPSTDQKLKDYIVSIYKGCEERKICLKDIG